MLGYSFSVLGELGLSSWLGVSAVAEVVIWGVSFPGDRVIGGVLGYSICPWLSVVGELGQFSWLGLTSVGEVILGEPG